MNKIKINETHSLSDTAYQALRQAILSGELAAGFFASDRELCERFSFSRTPVREAVLRLRDEQLVEVLPRKGMRVCALMVDDMREMSVVLKALAVQAAAQISADALDASDVATIEDHVSRMEKTVSDEDRGVWLDAETQFHMHLIRLCKNKRLIGIYENLFGLMERARYFTLYLRQTPVESTEEYRQILSALTPGGRERLVQVYSAHWQRSSDEMLQLISKYTKGTVRASLGM